MNKKYDIMVYIGRFQPFTKEGHTNIVNKALQMSSKVVICIGSVNKERSIKNPFTYYERCNIIKSSMENNDNILFRPIPDFSSDKEWIENIKFQVEDVCVTLGINPLDAKIALIGMDKDESSYYLEYFNFWDYIEYKKPENIVSATDVRDILFSDNFDIEKLKNLVHNSTIEFLKTFKNSMYYISITNKENK